jgi:hypothetical protein
MCQVFCVPAVRVAIVVIGALLAAVLGSSVLKFREVPGTQ